ncbi:hypothetical protein AX15_001620 [Amanita polypyramis BW_CC]|nr:hypothetical protein AX15_001620 [Amanita polypyramis BW_CC]
MTSSLRNSIHRPTHKERPQLAHRRKYGILEKHADYVKRAQDYHSKQDRLTRLRQKAAERNKDEFYFSMVKEKTRGGVHVKDRGNVALPTDVVKVLKTQDENYVRTMRMANLKKIDGLKRQLMEMIDPMEENMSRDSDDDDSLDSKEVHVLREAGIMPSPWKGKGRQKTSHIVFVDNEEEARKLANKNEQSSEEGRSEEISVQTVDLGWRISTSEKRKKKQTKSTTLESDVDMDMDEQIQEEMSTPPHRSRTRLLKELSARLVRDRQLRYTQREFEMQRVMMGKGARKKITGVEKVDEEDDDDEEDEDEIDARKGKQRKASRKVGEAAYKPRVYKWKLERKR